MAIEPSQLTAVILAGGKGSRLGAITAKMPKPMLMVEGRPFLDWVILFLYSEGLRRIIVSAGYHGKVIADHLKSISLPGLDLDCVTESSPLGTGGAIRKVATTTGHTPEAWLVLNGDSMVMTSLSPLWHCLTEKEASGAILGIHTTDSSRYGSLEQNAQGALVAFGEKRFDGAGLINAGVYLLRPSLISCLPPAEPLSLECDAFPHWLRRGKHLKVHACSAPFLDIGTPESLARAADFIALHKKTILHA